MKLSRGGLSVITMSIILTNSFNTINASEHSEDLIGGSKLSNLFMQSQKTTTGPAVTVDTEAPEVTLSQINRSGRYYLVIKASDDETIDRVTVNGEEINFPAEGGTKEHLVSKSGQYLVVVTDNDGNETEESYNVDLTARNPLLKVSKVYEDKKWYLMIKFEPTNDNVLSKVMINDKDISFESKGDEIKYKVPATETYKVTVTDDLGMESSESIEVDIRDIPDSEYPVLHLSQSNSDNSTYLVITATDNGKIAKVTVNGSEVKIPTNGDPIKQKVEPGRYRVVVTDNDGNETISFINITALAPVVVKKEVKFTLSSKEWWINGTKQANMDVLPINKDGRIFLPLRYTAYALGINSDEINWDEKSQTATIYDDTNVIKVTAGSKTMLLNGKAITMEVAAFTQNGRVFLPISQVSKAFSGVGLNWNNTNKEITITRSR